MITTWWYANTSEHHFCILKVSVYFTWKNNTNDKKSRHQRETGLAIKIPQYTIINSGIKFNHSKTSANFQKICFLLFCDCVVYKMDLFWLESLLQLSMTHTTMPCWFRIHHTKDIKPKKSSFDKMFTYWRNTLVVVTTEPLSTSSQDPVNEYW